MDELCRCGVKEEDVTMIVGVGTHRPATSDELSKLAGPYEARIRTVSHDCNASKVKHVGTTTRGNAIELNELYVDADLKILTGDVEFHYCAGYGGGRKSILPAIAGAESIQRNHSLLLDPQAKTGVLKGNPVSEDMEEAAEFARPDFILNVVMNGAGDTVEAYAGDMEKAFLEGVALVDRVWKVPVERKVDIIVVSAGGAPRDVNLYQAYKGLHNSLDTLSDGGVAILVAECQEGDGNQVFREWMTKFRDSKEMGTEIREHFRIGGHKAYYLMKALEKAKIYLVSTMPDFSVNNIFKMRSSRTVNTALQSAFRAMGKDSKVTVMPYGSITLPALA
jgi:nickel-dependent lactate racemase